MTDVIIETAKQHKASLNQAKKETPRRARGHPHLGLSYRRQLLARRPHPAQQVRPKWLPRAPVGPHPAPAPHPSPLARPAPSARFPHARQEDRHRTRRRRVRRPVRTRRSGHSLARAQSRRATGYTLVVNRKHPAPFCIAPSLLAADRERDAEDVRAPSRKPRVARAHRRRGRPPRDSDSSPTPTAKTKSEAPSRARPSSAPSRGRPSSAPAAKRRVSVSDAGDDDARGKLRKPRPSSARSSTKAGADADARAGARAVPRVSRPSTPRGPNDHMRRTASRSYTTETLMVKRAGIGNPVCVVHRRLDDASPEKAAEEIISFFAVQTKLDGRPVASLVNARTAASSVSRIRGTGATRDRPRHAFPGSVFVALTAGRCARAREASRRGSIEASHRGGRGR